MPTRKQRKRAQKERRHEYETVWVDAEGNELEEAPDDVPAPARERRPEGKKPQRQQQRSSSRATRAPLPPSWRRAARRALLLGVVIFVLFGILGSKGGKNGFVSAAFVGGIYTLLFIPFTYYVDRFVYNRWQRKAGEQAKKR